MKIAAKTLAAFLMIFTHIIKHRQGSSLSGRTFSPAAFSVLNTENLNIFRKGVFNGEHKNKDRIRGKSERRSCQNNIGIQYCRYSCTAREKSPYDRP
jgi:hypothetical protein